MILLDTHVLIWAQTEPSRLSREATRVIKREESKRGLAVSDVSLFECARYIAESGGGGGRRIEESLRALFDGADLHVIPISLDVALAAARLPQAFPGDPMDRIITGTAIAHHIPLVTRDDRIRSYPFVETIW